jgi:crotonobetainyl-CoA:carnitine CoA-transferase CaiB-like acyl-CoA transferase
MQLLDGVRVLESAQLFNGDTLGVLLADLGADVIKVESPFRGDYLRDFLGQVVPHNSPAHLQVNKNKRSVALDLRGERGRDVFFRLLQTADVFVDGNASNALEKLGIGYEQQRAVKPDIVYCQYSGYGSTGPYAPIPTHGQMMNAAAAAIPLMTDEDGLVRPDTRPQFFNGFTSGGEGTAAGAVYAAYHVAAALLRRTRTGEGAHIDVAASEAVISSAWIGATYMLNEHRITDRRGLPGQSEQKGGPEDSAKYQFYETKDGRYILFCAIEHVFWDNWCRAVGREDLVKDKDESRPVDFAGGAENLWLRREIQKEFWKRTQSEWVHIAAQYDIAMGPAIQPGQILEDEQLRERGVFVEAEHPVAGSFTHVTLPALVNGERSTVIRRHAPALGEQTTDVLSELGYGRDELAAMQNDKVIGGA